MNHATAAGPSYPADPKPLPRRTCPRERGRDPFAIVWQVLLP